MTFKKGGKAPVNGGRKTGTPNKMTAAKALAIQASGLTPLDFMIQVVRDASKPLEVRMDAAKAAAPYIHPRLASVEHTGAQGKPLIPEDNLTPNEIARRIAFALTHSELLEEDSELAKNLAVEQERLKKHGLAGDGPPH